MAILLWITTVILTFRATQPYILLTANLEDVQTIAKQILQSPVADQLTKIWRRAADQFAVNLQKPVKPVPHDSMLSLNAQEVAPQNSAAYPPVRRSDEQPRQAQATRRKDPQDSYRNKEDEELVDLGRNASRYLKSIRKLFERE